MAMLTQTFAPWLYLLIGMLIGGLVFASLARIREWARRRYPQDSFFPYLDVRLIDHIEPAPLYERKWYADPLTPREMEIALRAAAGERTIDIANALVISPHTVETHLKNIYKKLEVSSRLELAQVLAGLQQDDTHPP